MSNTQGGIEAPAEAKQPKPETENKPKPVSAERKSEVKAKKTAKKKAVKKKAAKKAGTKKPLARKTKGTKGKSKKVKKAVAAEKTTLNFKVVPAEAKAIKVKADKLCNGNVTQLVRLSILAWRPNKKALTDIRRTTRA